MVVGDDSDDNDDDNDDDYDYETYCLRLLRCLSRVAACIPELMKLDLDARSTAAYGLTHILCALTVTNRELRAKALADKDITPEQFDQLSELQRIKTKDEEGNVIEEKKVELHTPPSLDGHVSEGPFMLCVDKQPMYTCRRKTIWTLPICAVNV